MAETIRFGRFKEVLDVPALTELHVKAYVKFLQREAAPDKREDYGLESILRETFPIKNYDGTVVLEYVQYEIGQPRYLPEECRMLRLSYGAPLKVRLRLVKPDGPVEDDGRRRRDRHQTSPRTCSTSGAPLRGRRTATRSTRVSGGRSRWASAHRS